MNSNNFNWEFLPYSAKYLTVFITVCILSVFSYGSVKFSRVSTTSTGEQASNIVLGKIKPVNSQFSDISPDGRFVVFLSDANNLVSGDTNGLQDIFLKDTWTGNIVKVNTRSDGSQPSCSYIGGGNNTFGHPDVSSWGANSFDGELRVSFISCNEVINETNNGYWHVFVKIFDPNNLSSVSPVIQIDENGAGESGNYSGYFPQISDDGSAVAFGTGSNNLIFNIVNGVRIYYDQNNQNDVYVRKFSGLTSSLTMVSSSNGIDGRGEKPCINGDGSKIAFVSRHSFSPDDSNSHDDYYLYSGASRTLLSYNETNTSAGDAPSSGIHFTSLHDCDLSSDGRYFVFNSSATNLSAHPAFDSSGSFPYIRDLTLGQTSFLGIPEPTDGRYLGNSQYHAMVSNNGRLVSFAYNSAIFLSDRTLGVVRRIAKFGLNGVHSYPSINNDGRFMSFHSPSSNLVPGDTNSTSFVTGDDVFVHDLVNNAQLNRGDINADGVTDYSVFRPNFDGVGTSKFYSLLGHDLSYSEYIHGLNGDIPTPADFDGDGKTDNATFRPSDGTWRIVKSSDLSTITTSFGSSGDIPQPADFDGDGKADIALWRPSNAVWYILASTNGYSSQAFGAIGDIPVTGDYDKDGKADLAIFRPSTGDWWIEKSYDSSSVSVHFGATGDKPIQSDFNGDGQTDLAVFRASGGNGEWYWMSLSHSGSTGTVFGLATDIPIPGDFDNDGLADYAFFRPSTGYWYVYRSSDGGYSGFPFGSTGDIPIPAAY